MDSYAKKFSKEQIEDQCKYLWGATLDLLYKKEQNYELLDERIQSVINLIAGHSALFNNSPKVISICAMLERARVDDLQFRKCIMDSLGLIDALCLEIQGGVTDV